MKPIVLIGGGENHYRLIHSLTEEIVEIRPIILISEKSKYFSKNFLPLVVGDLFLKENALFDLWSVCQRKNVYFIQDECVNINREDKIVHLKKYGKLSYHLLSIETECKAFSMVSEVGDCPSVFENQNAEKFLLKIKSFLSEAYKHCPKEIRIVFTGVTQNSLDLAYFLNKKLLKSCEKVDLVFIAQDNTSSDIKKSFSKKINNKLKELNIRILFSQTLEKLNDHKIIFTDGSILEFDIFIPFDNWRSVDSISKLFQNEGLKIQVQRDLSLSTDPSLFFLGQNVFFKDENVCVESLSKDEIIKVMKHNIFSKDELAPRLTCRNQKLMPFKRPYLNGTSPFSFFNSKNGEAKANETLQEQSNIEIKFLHDISVLNVAKKQMQEKLIYDAQHMSRPWQGFVEKKLENPSLSYRLLSSNGFNNWGSYAQSTIKICQFAFFKAVSQGVKPEYLRFNLTLPRKTNELDLHIFESTFKAIEEVTKANQIEMDGGDTFDGQHWHLSVTIGGKSLQSVTQKFSAHDYLIMTRPLGFGFLWANRFHDKFDSQCVTEAIESQILVSYEKWMQFVEKYKPSASVMIEEWGFLYHCLQSLPSHQQLMINFREVPRWKGIESILINSNFHPGLDLNWERIKDSVAFQKSEVSLNNSILWDSLSQGSVVMGVRAQDYKEAIKSLKELGFENASLVGCIRPKNSNNRVVLSDWSPL